MRERTVAFALARKSGTPEPVIVDPIISPWPYLYFNASRYADGRTTSDISTHWERNKGIARFYGISAVRRTAVEDF